MNDQNFTNIELDSILRKINLSIDGLQFEIRKASAVIVQARQEYKQLKEQLEIDKKNYDKEFDRLAKVI